MNETVLIAGIAVLGTLLGASVSPLIGLVRDALTARTDKQSGRIRAAANFGIRMMASARICPDKFDSVAVRKAKGELINERFELASVIPRGAGNVDRFTEHSITTLAMYGDARTREFVAKHATTELLDWARGDKPASKLYMFEVDRYGDELNIR